MLDLYIHILILVSLDVRSVHTCSDSCVFDVRSVHTCSDSCVFDVRSVHTCSDSCVFGS